MKIEKNKSLKTLNTFGIPAIAENFVQINSLIEAQELLKNHQLPQPIHILGGGSNILITQEKIAGTIIQNNIKGITTIEENDETITLKVGAGENWHEFVLFCLQNNYAGTENLALIPGNIGATPIQNIGAYGVEIQEIITEVHCLNLENGDEQIFTNSECEFSYRNSIFKTKLKNKFLITSVTYNLSKKPKLNTSYYSLQKAITEKNIPADKLTIQKIADIVTEIRTQKLPNSQKIGNAGSFFKNPIITETQFHQLLQDFPQIPHFPQAQNLHKIPAGWLIEQAGWRGFTDGKAGVYEKQALILVNHGQATGQDIFQLSEKIINSVQEKFNITLEREVNTIP